jgi:hypothetical protein
MFEVDPSKNPLSETNKNLYSAEPCKAAQNEYNNTLFVRAKKTFQKIHAKKIEKMAAQKVKPTRIGKTENQSFRKPTVGGCFSVY